MKWIILTASLFLTFTTLAQTKESRCLRVESDIVKSCTTQKFRAIDGLAAKNNFIEDVDFNEASFRRSTFKNVKFSNVDFRGAKFNKVVFIDCTFEDSDFSGSRWNQSQLVRPTFIKTQFLKAFFSNVQMTFNSSEEAATNLFETCFSIGSSLKVGSNNASLCKSGLF